MLQPQAKTLVNLQIARFFAALSVAVVHLQHEISKTLTHSPNQLTPFLWFPWGFGVDIFFVLSGFVMILTSSKLGGGPADASEFFKRRFERVTPLYWIFTGVMLLAMAASGMRSEIAASHVLASLLYMPIPGPTGAINPILSVGWTINYEMFFYAVFSLTLLLPIRRSRNVLFITLATLVVIGAIVPSLPQPWLYWTRPILLEFLVGCALGVAYIKGKRLSLTLSVGLICVAFALLFAASAQEIAEGQAYRWWCLGIPASLIVAALAFSRQLKDQGIVRVLHLLGDASYALYLVHPFVIAGSAIIWRKLNIPSIAAFVLFALLASVIGSWIVHRVIEKPILRLMKDRPHSFLRSGRK
jgi:exopolysaccharide production protein ExoZ